MNQSGRMENVRAALLVMLPKGYHDELGNSLTEHKALAALAEVEEWETQAYADQVLIYDLRTRAEEAEAEVQRLRDEYAEHVGTDVI